jgi:2-polyprenyl-3-methyl-5-hydroxy-6-metoxy-1,4-benzoquinol methylase
MRTIALNWQLKKSGFVDLLTIEQCGLVRLSGWASASSAELKSSIELELPEGTLPPCHIFRTFRPDVAIRHGARALRIGFVAEFLILDEHLSSLRICWLEGSQRRVICEVPLKGVLIERPAYDGLFSAIQPLRRNQIYGSGPPVNVVTSEIEWMIDEFEGDILDFGCGAGALVRALRSRGKSAFGLELDRSGIRQALTEDVAPHIRLYDGSFPSPIAAGEFDTVVSTEVIEHIENYRAALAEMARVTRNRLVLTTPDMSAIPLLFPHQAVPWHLLEATHISFFTQNSLTAALSEFFAEIDMLRIGPNTINGTLYYTSLMAVCSGPITPEAKYAG